MNRKWLPYLLMALMLVAIVLIRQCKGNQDPVPKPKVTNPDRPKDPASNPTNRDKGFDRSTSYLDYSQHASCRMQCRKISKSEVEEIMLDGKINYKKSDLQNARRVRIIFAQCNEKTVVVTVIDLGTDYACDCPGDDNQYKNKGR